MSQRETIVDTARMYARMEHAGQLYGNGEPYETHLADVVAVLLRFRVSDETTLATAWLHDVLEDSNVTYQRLALSFSIAIADAVWALTGVGENRRERNTNAYEKIVSNPVARLVKLADRIANVEAGGVQTETYRKEHYQFQRALKVPNSLAPEREMWGYLDDTIGRMRT